VPNSYLSYFGIRVTDLDRSLGFYTKFFGLKEVARGDSSSSGGGTAILLKDPFSGQRLELNWYPPGSQYAVPFLPGEGLDHLAFRVADLPETLRRLAADGFPPVRPGDPVELGPDLKFAYVADPDGNWVELWQYASQMPESPPETY
jgi:catechol 2,3-dioxygenase-like lactoylglutathione lyase family enzyme